MKFKFSFYYNICTYDINALSSSTHIMFANSNQFFSKEKTRISQIGIHFYESKSVICTCTYSYMINIHVYPNSSIDS